MMKKLFSLMLTLLLTAALLCGCGSSGGNSNEWFSYQPTGEPVYTAAEKLDPSAVTLPLAEPVTLSTWWPTNHPEVTDPGEILYLKEAMKRTGVSFEFIVPPYGTETETYSLIFAGERYPALMKGMASLSNSSVVGPEFAYKQGIIIALEDYLAYMPEIDAYYHSTDEIRRSLTSESGHLLGFPVQIYSAGTAFQGGSSSGYALRADWLANLGLGIPTTYAELETVLAGMQRFTPHPMELRPHADSYGLLSGYQLVGSGWSVRDGKVCASVLQEEYREYVTMLHDWVEKGYISEDFFAASNSWEDGLGKVSREELGVFFCLSSMTPLFYNSAIDPDFSMEPIPPMRRSTQDRIHVANNGTGNALGACVTIECEHPEYLCAFFNYFFTEEGILLSNYGVEGESFRYVDGVPVMSDSYRAKEAEFDRNYARISTLNSSSPGIIWWDSDLEPGSPVRRFAGVWDAPEYSDSDWVIPSGTAMNSEESKEYANLNSEYSVYLSEQLIRFISGKRPMSEWDAFTDQARSMGLDRAQEIMQQAYDRYMAR